MSPTNMGLARLPWKVGEIVAAVRVFEKSLLLQGKLFQRA